MRDLTGSESCPAYLVPSSTQSGNATASDPRLSRTAPGSVSGVPVSGTPDGVPLPVDSGPEIPVSHPGCRDKVAVSHGRPGAGSYKDAHDIASGGPWGEAG